MNRLRRPYSYPKRHTLKEETQIKNSSKKTLPEIRSIQWSFEKGIQTERLWNGKRMGLAAQKSPKRKAERTGDIPNYWPPGEKMQIDIKEVPYNWLRGSVLRDGKHLYQWTAIDECTRMRFVYGFEEHAPENSVRFLAMLIKAFLFRIKMFIIWWQVKGKISIIRRNYI